MSEEKEKPFRERCANFTSAECERLARLVESHGSVLLDPRTDTGVLQEKARAWSSLADQFNAQRASAERPRTLQQLRNKFRNLKKMWRDKMGDEGDIICSVPFDEDASKDLNMEENVAYFDIDDSGSDSALSKRLHASRDSDNDRESSSPPKKRMERTKNSKMSSRHAEELHKQELKHREELHTLRVTQMKALHKLEVERLKLKLLKVKQSLDNFETDDSDNKDAD